MLKQKPLRLKYARAPLPLAASPRLFELPCCSYDSSTTVAEAVESLAHQMKLENYQTFTLFAVHKVGR